MVRVAQSVRAGSTDAAVDFYHYDLLSQDGSTLVCGLETVEQINDLIAKMLANAPQANAKKNDSLMVALASVGTKS